MKSVVCAKHENYWRYPRSKSVRDTEIDDDGHSVVGSEDCVFELEVAVGDAHEMHVLQSCDESRKVTAALLFPDGLRAVVDLALAHAANPLPMKRVKVV